MCRLPANLIVGLAAAGALTLAASGAFAQGRPSTLAMTCGQAQAMVNSRGAIVLSTGPNTFDRFVANRSFCSFDEETIATWAPTRDNRQCMVGWRCEQRRSFPFDR